MNIEEKIREQQRLNDLLKKIKADEANIRLEIATELLKGKASGTHKFKYDGMTVKVVRSISYSLDQKKLKEKIENDELSTEEIDALNVKYELSLTRYKNLDLSPGIDDVLTTKDAMPTIDVSYA